MKTLAKFLIAKYVLTCNFYNLLVYSKIIGA
jgi:hypothetical protein